MRVIIFTDKKKPDIEVEDLELGFTLSNFDNSCEFNYEDETFRTIEHAMQYAKYRIFDQKNATQFSLLSGSKLSKRSGARARQIGRQLTLSLEQRKNWKMVYDIYIAFITEEKFSQNLLSEATLKLCDTKDAELWFCKSGDINGCVKENKYVRLHYLESIRERIATVQSVINTCLF